MEARYEVRKRELLDECKVAPEIFQEVETRLKEFMKPFVETFARCEQCEHAETYVSGLLSDLDQKNAESIAYRFGQERLGLQHFLGGAEWDDAPLRMELARQVGQQLGEADGVLVFDPSAFKKSGRESVGTARQWCGRLGKVDNCQVAVYLGYVSRQEHALVDVRLYLPKEWTRDKSRCHKAGVPKTRRRHRTRHQLCLDMLQEKGGLLPHAWVTGDDELGRVFWFRRQLHSSGERYLLAVPSNTLIRDREAEPPPYSGRGRRPKAPWQRVDKWTGRVPDEAWSVIEVRDGSKGPLQVEILKRKVVARTPKRREGHAEMLVVIRYRDRDDDRVVKVDYYLSDAEPETPLAEFARVAKAEHRIEECLRRAKSEAGLADYQVRNWPGWHHHQTLGLLASWFLVTETRRGKKMDTLHHPPADPRRDCLDPSHHVSVRSARPHLARTTTLVRAERTGTLTSLEAA
jgi:SRSO17 transposase